MRALYGGRHGFLKVGADPWVNGADAGSGGWLGIYEWSLNHTIFSPRVRALFIVVRGALRALDTQ